MEKVIMDGSLSATAEDRETVGLFSERELSDLRRGFPHTANQIYLNHAGVGALHQNTVIAVQACLEERSEGHIEYWPEGLEVREGFRERVARLINAKPEQIAVTENTSMGLNWLAQGLSWQPGDRILLNDFEFPANVYPFLALREKGVEIDMVPHRNGAILLEDLEKAIRPETRLLSLSFVEFLNGFRNDLTAIGRLCRKNDIIFSVDAIQGVGAMQLDVQQTGADFVASGGQKWLLWPRGTAFMYVSPRIFAQLKPMAVGWLSVSHPWEFFREEYVLHQTAARFEPGVYNVMGIAGANAALDVLLDVGGERIEKQVLYNSGLLTAGLQEQGYRLFSALGESQRSGIVTFFHPRAGELAEYLTGRRICVSLREGMIRVSPHFYNSSDDIDVFLAELTQFESR